MSKELILYPPLPTRSQRSQWGGLPGASRAAALYSALNKEGRFALVVTRDAEDSQEWYQALKFFSAASDDFFLANFPDQEILPYDHFSPHPDIVSERLQTLYKLQSATTGVCLVSAPTLQGRLCPREYINRESLLLRCGQQADFDTILRQLDSAGYQRCETVFDHGEYAVRGALLDIFPMGSRLPFRIELYDSSIDSLRTFDPETQRSIEKIERITVLPAGEISLDKNAIEHFRDNWHVEFNHDPDACPIYRDTLSGIPSAGIEAYLPMLYSETESLFDYLPQESLVVSYSELGAVLDQRLKDIDERYQQQAIDPSRPLLPPDKLYLSREQCLGRIKNFPRIECRAEPLESCSERGLHSFSCAANPELRIDPHANNPLGRIQSLLGRENSAARLLFCVESEGRREVLREQLQSIDCNAVGIDSWEDYCAMLDENCQKPQLAIALAKFNRGAYFAEHKLNLIAEAELFGVEIKASAAESAEKRVQAEASIRNLIELRVGAAIAHIDHGVGRYLGLEHMPIDDGRGGAIDAEFLTLEYAGGDRLYVPVTSLHLISRYLCGDESLAPLSRLGSEQWGKAKKKAIANIRDVAAELLDIYARRKSSPGFSFSVPDEEYRKFCAKFPFDETLDQRRAIDAVLSDMQADNAMDRLICGDVGFGKTEVAMRAAFVAASNSKQVMVLVPTTLLAQQHQQNFIDRFAGCPIRIDTLSRFRTATEQKQVSSAFASGEIDILIGTHKLIQSELVSLDLGLVIIDEEHRFGVRQKEQLKRLCAGMDLLTMTATPIPRTLNMAMSGLRDLSIIATAPARRLSVKTFVHEKQSSILKEAMLRELLRGGQVFYLHNDIDGMARSAEEIRALLPEARVATAHGQMPERELERVMADFYHKKFNILVCSTIIETGIDIPNANTIIIERADKFGLAQLHQLRGRVGRSHHQAYAYLLIPERKRLGRDAEKRLLAIEEAQDLGAGFMLATHDLEIRGAGELLGEEQSGQLQSIGFSLYLDMLERAVSALKSGETVDLGAPLNLLGEINLHLPALIPDDYLPDVHNRLLLYKRITSADSRATLRELQVEMIDRFGLLRGETKNLFSLMEIKLDCIALGVKKIDLGENAGYMLFHCNTRVDPMKIVQLVQQQPEVYQLSGATRLTFCQHLPESSQRIQWLAGLITELGSPHGND